MSAMQADGMSMAARFVDGARVRLCAIAWTLSCILFLFPANASSGDMSAWEEQRRAHAGQDMESFKRVIENRRDRLIASRPGLQRKQLEGIEVTVGTDAYYTLVCEASVFVDDNGNRRRQLRMTVETIVTIYKVAGAIALRILDPSLGDEWSRDYLLYMRKTPNGVPIVDPLRASGLITATGAIRPGVSREIFTKWEEDSKALADSMLMFLVAHEIGHFANWFTDRQTTESEVDFERRKRASEAEADKFGLAMLLDIERSNAGFSPADRPQFFAKGAPIVFLWWVLSMEGSRHPIAAGTHPLDHVRALATSELILANIDSFGLTPKEREQLIHAAAELRDEMAIIEKEGQKFFDDLDLKAADITVATLSRRP